MQKLIFLLLCLLPGLLNTIAQNNTKPGSVVSTIQIDNSIFLIYPRVNNDVSKKQKNVLLKSATTIGFVGAALACYRLVDAELQEELQEHKNQTKKNRLWNFAGHAGLGKYNTIAWGSTTAVAYLFKNTRLQKTVNIWGGSLMLNSFITDKMKLGFQRHRPNTGSPFNSFDGIRGPKLNKSFPSAHTSNAFTTATVFATIYKEKKWLPPVAYGIASLTGLSRIYNNAHWASDVLVGTAIGFLSAKLMIALYQYAEKKFILIIPQHGKEFSSLSFIYTF